MTHKLCFDAPCTWLGFFRGWVLKGLFLGVWCKTKKTVFSFIFVQKNKHVPGSLFFGLSAQLFGSSWWPLPHSSDWQLPSLSKRKGGRGGIVNTRPIERFPQKKRKTIIFRCQRILVRCQSLMLSYIWRMASRPQRPHHSYIEVQMYRAK